MASGRVGGTKSRIYGKVGNEIYSARKNADGDYQQIVSDLPETHTDTLTPDKVRQRIVMSIIYRHMQQLAPVIEETMIDAGTANMFLNDFVRRNVQILREIMLGYVQTDFPVWFPLYGEVGCLPAPVQMASRDYSFGFLQFNGQMAGEDHFECYISPNYYMGALDWRDFQSYFDLKVGDTDFMYLLFQYPDPAQNHFEVVRFTWNPKPDHPDYMTQQNCYEFFDIECSVPYSIGNFFTISSDDVPDVRYAGESILLCHRQRVDGWVWYWDGTYTTNIYVPSSLHYRTLNDVWDSWYTDRI